MQTHCESSRCVAPVLQVLPEMLHQPLVESLNGIAVKRHVSKLTALKRLQALSLRKQTLAVDDFEVLFSVIGPQLKVKSL